MGRILCSTRFQADELAKQLGGIAATESIDALGLWGDVRSPDHYVIVPDEIEEAYRRGQLPKKEEREIDIFKSSLKDQKEAAIREVSENSSENEQSERDMGEREDRGIE